MNCIFCHAKMVLATESRGFRTYRCSRGCADYQYEEINARAAAPTISPGTLQNIPAVIGVFAQTAAMT